ILFASAEENHDDPLRGSLPARVVLGRAVRYLGFGGLQNGGAGWQLHCVRPSWGQFPRSAQNLSWPPPPTPQMEPTLAPVQEPLQTPPLGRMIAFNRLLEAGVLKPGRAGVEAFAAQRAGAVEARASAWLGNG